MSGVDVPAVQRTTAQEAVHPGLQWWTDTDYPHGWRVKHGYTVDWDDGRANVWIHVSELDDNHTRRPVHLPKSDLNQIESLIAEEVEAEAHDAALALARDPADDGDYDVD